SRNERQTNSSGAMDRRHFSLNRSYHTIRVVYRTAFLGIPNATHFVYFLFIISTAWHHPCSPGRPFHQGDPLLELHCSPLCTSLNARFEPWPCPVGSASCSRPQLSLKLLPPPPRLPHPLSNSVSPASRPTSPTAIPPPC